MKKPIISIVVPIYKIQENYLRKSIESLICQTMSEIEIILVDDGSPDDCGKICDEYAVKDARIRVIHNENRGLAAARNIGYNVAQGECLMFVDGDDYIEKETCEQTYSLLKKYNVELVFWNCYKDYHNSTVPQIIFSYGDRLYNSEGCKYLQSCVLDFNHGTSSACMKLISLDYLRKYNIRHCDEMKQGAEGLIFTLSLFEHMSSAYYLSKPLYHYVYNPHSITHIPKEANVSDTIRCFEYIESYIQNSKNKDRLLHNLYNRLLYVIVNVGVSYFFHPLFRVQYNQRLTKYKEFLKTPIIAKALRNADRRGLSLSRRIILQLVKWEIFSPLVIIGKLRKKQLDHR